MSRSLRFAPLSLPLLVVCLVGAGAPRHGGAPLGRPEPAEEGGREAAETSTRQRYGGEHGGPLASRLASSGAVLPDTSLRLSGDLELEEDGKVFLADQLLLRATFDGSLGLGLQALRTSSIGEGNTALGNFALSVPSFSGFYNTAVGASALRSALSSIGYNVAVGHDALGQATEQIFDNTAIGAQALSSSTQGASGNTAVGRNALRYADGTLEDNTAVGFRSMWRPNGTENVAIGRAAMEGQTDTDPAANVAVGHEALKALGEARANVALGWKALRNTTSSSGDLAEGAANVAVGYSALLSNTTGIRSTAVGFRALESATGSSNTAIGAEAGTDVTTGVYNIHLGAGVTGSSGDSYTTRIGSKQTTVHFAGISGQVAGSGAKPVYVGADGKLGDTAPSTRRLKREIEDLGERSRGALDLRPVSFRYLGDPSGGDAPPKRWGLIAEEVAEVFPELVRFDAEGRPEGVHYHQLIPLLLNELQRQERRLDAQRTRAERTEDQLQALREELERLRASTTTVAP